jgi:hypothetical protein
MDAPHRRGVGRHQGAYDFLDADGEVDAEKTSGKVPLAVNEQPTPVGTPPQKHATKMFTRHVAKAAREAIKNDAVLRSSSGELRTIERKTRIGVSDQNQWPQWPADQILQKNPRAFAVLGREQQLTAIKHPLQVPIVLDRPTRQLDHLTLAHKQQRQTVADNGYRGHARAVR